MKKALFMFLAILAVSTAARPVQAVSVSPAVIDEKAYPRDVVEKTVILENATSAKVPVYISVFNINAATGERSFPDPAAADYSVSAANWIEITRGVIEMAPGERREAPLTIRVNLRAKPGTYHAAIMFLEGTTRQDAESRIEGMPSIAVNIEVLDDAKEQLQLKAFAPAKNLFAGFPVPFSLAVENIGNRLSVPKGEIRIYDKRGAEVDAVKVGESGEGVAPSNVLQLASVWDPSAMDGAGPLGGFGRYKAMLDLRYGGEHPGTMQDTVFFWVLPWKHLFAIFTVLAISVVAMALAFHERRQRKFAVSAVAARAFDDAPYAVPAEPSISQRESAVAGRNSRGSGSRVVDLRKR